MADTANRSRGSGRRVRGTFVPEARCGYRNPTLASILATQMPCRTPSRSEALRSATDALRRLLARRSAGAVLKPSGGNCAVLPYLHFPPIQQPAAPPWNIPTGRAAGCFSFCLFMGSVRGGSTRAGFVWALARPGAWKHSTALSAHPPQRKAEPDHSNHPAGRG